MDERVSDNATVVLYGNGGHLGNFQFFADDLVTEDLVKRFHKSNIRVLRTGTREEFFKALASTDGTIPDKIQELHVFSHSIGGGLYVGYGDESLNRVREDAARNYPNDTTIDSHGRVVYTKTCSRKIPYEKVLKAEEGGVLTDHLAMAPWNQYRDAIRRKFIEGATAKFWGCNAGVSGWIYSDELTLENGQTTVVYEQNAPADGYYWRALNTANVPKPSIAQAFANYFGRRVLGATTGAHVEVMDGNHWITSQQYKDTTKRWPGKAQVLRLAPIKGGHYVPFNPL